MNRTANDDINLDEKCLNSTSAGVPQPTHNVAERSCDLCASVDRAGDCRIRQVSRRQTGEWDDRLLVSGQSEWSDCVCWHDCVCADGQPIRQQLTIILTVNNSPTVAVSVDQFLHICNSSNCSYSRTINRTLHRTVLIYCTTRQL